MEEISRFERLLTSISLRLEGVSGESVVPEIRWALEAVGAYFGVQRALLTEFREGPEGLPFYTYWSRPGIHPSTLEAVLPLLDTWYYRTISSGEIVRLSDVFKELPPECDAEGPSVAAWGSSRSSPCPSGSRGRSPAPSL